MQDRRFQRITDSKARKWFQRKIQDYQFHDEKMTSWFSITNFMMRRWYHWKCRIINLKENTGLPIPWWEARNGGFATASVEYPEQCGLFQIQWRHITILICENCHYFLHLRNFRPLNSQRSQCTNSRRPRRWHSRIGFPRNCNIVSEMLVVTIV